MLIMGGGGRALFVRSNNGGLTGGGGGLFMKGCVFSWLFGMVGWKCTRLSKDGRMV